MNDTSQDIAQSLLAGNFERSSPDVKALSDPIVDTPMVLTLDELRPYEFNPRITRNPLYDEIKASILKRGLDTPPAITRRPGKEHYIIRNGGNTRLSILRELWSETKDEKFFRICCLYRPWQGEIVALTGHLAENELHGGLTFVESALGVEKAREIYEQENGEKLSQGDLAKQLSEDGYPCHQSQISRMQDTVNYLLPAIPIALYAGLNNRQIRKLLSLRQAAVRFWIEHVRGDSTEKDFLDIYQEVLALFDTEPGKFDLNRIRDELIGRMAELLDISYDLIALDLSSDGSRQQALQSPPSDATQKMDASAVFPARKPIPEDFEKPDLADVIAKAGNYTAPAPIGVASKSNQTLPATAQYEKQQASGDDETDQALFLQAHIVSPAETSERVQSIQKMIAQQTGETLADFSENVVRAIPVQAGGLFPISDVWYIESAINTPERLRTHIEQLVLEIAEEAELTQYIEPSKTGMGFECKLVIDSPILALLGALSRSAPLESMQNLFLYEHLASLLLHAGERNARISDASVVKLFRLIRLGRRLFDLETLPPSESGAKLF